MHQVVELLAEARVAALLAGQAVAVAHPLQARLQLQVLPVDLLGQGQGQGQQTVQQQTAVQPATNRKFPRPSRDRLLCREVR